MMQLEEEVNSVREVAEEMGMSPAVWPISRKWHLSGDRMPGLNGCRRKS
jgi:hypothetical protein